MAATVVSTVFCALLGVASVSGINDPVTTPAMILNFSGSEPYVPDYGPLLAQLRPQPDPAGEARYVLGKRYFANDGPWHAQTIAGSHVLHQIQLSKRLYTPTGVERFGFQDGEASEARFHNPQGVWYHKGAGPEIIYVADCHNHAVRAIEPITGYTTTLAGTGLPGSWDDTNKRNATFRYPMGVVTDNDGTVYVADTHNHRIRRIYPSGGVDTLVGSVQGYANAVGENALFSYPIGLAIGTDGCLYVADSNNHCIRRIQLSTRIVSTYVGIAEPGWKDGFGPYARLHSPTGIAVHVDSSYLYVTDSGNQKIRRIDNLGVVDTIGGSSIGDADGWDQDSRRAKFNAPHGIAVAPRPPVGWTDTIMPVVYFTDKFNNRIRSLHFHHYLTNEQFHNNIQRPYYNCTSVAGSVPGFKDSNSTKSQLFEPAGMTMSPTGELIFADSRNHVIRKVKKALGGTCEKAKEECDVRRYCINLNGDICSFRNATCLIDNSCICDVLYSNPAASCQVSRRNRLPKNEL